MMITARAAKVPHKKEEMAEYESESSIQKIIIWWSSTRINDYDAPIIDVRLSTVDVAYIEEEWQY